MSLEIHRVYQNLPDDFYELLEAARAEEHRLLDRLVDEWSTGTLRFDRANEQLLIARLDSKIVGVGGITIEPANPSCLRMRRFYVVPGARRHGVAKALVRALLNCVPDPTVVGVHVGVADAFSFWEAIGFHSVESADITHIWATDVRP